MTTVFRKFLGSYLETLVWQGIGFENATAVPSDIALPFSVKIQSARDCRDFLRDVEASGLLDVVYSDPERAGHDFVLTRNRHGAGFWDGDWTDSVGNRLTEIAHAFGSTDIMLEHNGETYCL